MSSTNDTQHEGHEPMSHKTVLVILVFTLILQLWKCEDQINTHENENEITGLEPSFNYAGIAYSPYNCKTIKKFPFLHKSYIQIALNFSKPC